MENFLTILSIAVIVFCVFQIIGINSYAGKHKKEIYLAELQGFNPVGDAARKPIIAIIVSVCWLISLLF